MAYKMRGICKRCEIFSTALKIGPVLHHVSKLLSQANMIVSF